MCGEQRVNLYLPSQSRLRGRPRQRWKNRVKEGLRRLGVQNREEIASNRETPGEVF